MLQIPLLMRLLSALFWPALLLPALLLPALLLPALHLPALLLPALLRLPWRQSPYISGCQEVHHCLVAYLHGKQLRNLHMSVSARFPAWSTSLSFQSFIFWCFNRLQCRTRCTWVCTSPPLHHLHMSSSRFRNCFRYAAVGACPLFSG